MGQPCSPLFLHKIMKKIYTTKYSKLSLTLERGGVSAKVEFKNGRMNDNVPARFITSDPFLQYMIEKDSRFGNLFRLERAIPEPSDIKPEEEDAVEEVETKAKTVESVKDLADAIDYFSGMGKLCTTSKQVKAAMKTYNVEFPNWK